jgi:hypothetical protein
MSMLAMTVACGSATDPLGPNAHVVHNVLITVAVPGTCLFSCDPPGPNLTLALVTVLNTGTTTSYLQTCGQQAAYAEQVLVDGQWLNVGPAITCPVGNVPISLAAGDSVQINWFFASGRRRVTLGVGSKVDMSDAGLATSAEVDIPPK